MRILIVGSNHRAEIRAATVLIHGLARTLRDRGHDVTLLQAAAPEHQVEIEGIHQYYTADTSKSFYPLRFFLRRISDFDVIHAHDQSAAFFALRSRVRALPLAVEFHPPRLRRASFWKTNWRWRYIELAARYAPLSLFPSRWLADEMTEFYGLDPSRIRVIHNGIGESWFDDYPDARTTHNGARRIVAVNMKGVDIALRAFAKIRERHDAVLELYGVHKETERYKALARELGVADRVEFCGFVDNALLPARIAGAHALVNPTEKDNYPQVLQEVQALGIPAVTTSVGGIPEIVLDGQTGILCSRLETEPFAEGLDRLLGDPALQQRMRDFGKSRARDLWLWPNAVERLEKEIYAPLMARATRAGG